MTSKPRLLFYFLHLLGVGHVYRAKRLIEGFANTGIAVDVVYGGEPIPGITFEAESVHYLPPIRAGDNAYSFYLDENGNKLGAAFQEHRKTKLLEIFEKLHPDVILTEAFPFGRRMVRKELKALFEAAKGRAAKNNTSPPLIVSSVRDILQERKKPGRVEETRDLVSNLFDHVLVHSDPEIIRINETFPLAGEIQGKLNYTGFVVPASQKTNNPLSSFDILVSAGGGAFGGPLMEVALEAAAKRPKLKWCLTTGPNIPKKIEQRLRTNAPSNVTITRRLENLAGHMTTAKLSISQCGYNTAMDVLSVQSADFENPFRAIFVAYDIEGQSEQLRRAELLEKAGYAVSLPQSKLTPEKLLRAMTEAERLKPVKRSVNFNGVDNTAKIICQWLEERKNSTLPKANS